MNDSVKQYRLRRANRIMNRLVRHDEEDGHWITTDSGKKIHFNDEGAIDYGNQFALAKMGKPDGVEMPKKKVELKKQKPYKFSADTRESLGECLLKREDKNVVFGGYYKVGESGNTYVSMTFLNPYTGDYFVESIDTDNDMDYTDTFKSELYNMPINDDAAWVWNRSNDVVQTGDTVKVVKGRTIPHGTTAKVKSIRPVKDKYGRKVADYAYLDSGDKINIANLSIIEE